MLDRSTRTVLREGLWNAPGRRMLSRRAPGRRRIPVWRRPPEGANRSVMSPVEAPAWLGTLATAAQVFPRSFDVKIGALAPPKGLGVNADAAISRVRAGLTARLGSLSWFVSPLIALGMMLTTLITSTSSTRAGGCWRRSAPEFLDEAAEPVRLLLRQDVPGLECRVDRGEHGRDALGHGRCLRHLVGVQQPRRLLPCVELGGVDPHHVDAGGEQHDDGGLRRAAAEHRLDVEH